MKTLYTFSVIWMAALGCSTPAEEVPVADAAPFVPGPNPKSASLFDETSIPKFGLTFPPDDWAALTALWKDPQWKAPENQSLWDTEKGKYWVHCTFEHGGETADAACRLRGNPTDWFDALKPQFAIKFNRWNKDARFRGLRRISLEFNTLLAAPIRDRLGMTLMREAGLPAARVSHIRLAVDGKDYGIYMAIEAVDREFLEDHYADPDGNLYESGYIKQTNESDLDTSDMDDLADLIDSEPLGADHAELVTKLSAVMDMPQVIRVMAAESVFPTDDNLSNGSTNFYYYHVPGGRFLAIPWDLDEILSAKKSPATSPLYTWLGNADKPSKLLALVREVPEWKQAFEDTLVELRDGPHSKVAAQAAALCELLRPEVATDALWKEEYSLAAFDKDCEAIQKHVEDRSAFLKTALGR